MQITILDPSDLLFKFLEKEYPDMDFSFIKDKIPNAETTAMLQALYSRSPKPMAEHIDQVLTLGASKFMEEYYIRYGHDSIGQCATVTIAVEEVSMLAAKAIQSDTFYNGQESSTRYMDFSSKIPIYEDSARQNIHDSWLALYSKVFYSILAKLEKETPRPEDIPANQYQKTLKAKAFDVARGFLPCGTLTNLSWHTTLNGALKHLNILSVHPRKEVRQMASEIYTALGQKYPSSFPEIQVTSYLKKLGQFLAYPTENLYPEERNFTAKIRTKDVKVPLDGFIFTQRPKKTRLPKAVDMLMECTFQFQLDFGSFRDLQRHRIGHIPIPVVKGKNFHPWYLDQLSEDLQQEVISDMEHIYQELDILYEYSLEDIDYDNQELLPMGELVDIVIQVPLSQAVYIAELRSGQSVHPTLRTIAQQIALTLKEHFPDLKLYANMEEDKINFSRGLQDITKKEI